MEDIYLENLIRIAASDYYLSLSFVIGSVVMLGGLLAAIWSNGFSETFSARGQAVAFAGVCIAIPSTVSALSNIVGATPPSYGVEFVTLYVIPIVGCIAGAIMWFTSTDRDSKCEQLESED